MKITSQPPCPECEKLSAVSEDSNKIGEFLGWLSERNLCIARYGEYDFRLFPAHEYQGNSGINQILAEYYGIDLDKVEKERRALLKWLQEVQNEYRSGS